MGLSMYVVLLHTHPHHASILDVPANRMLSWLAIQTNPFLQSVGGTGSARDYLLIHSFQAEADPDGSTMDGLFVASLLMLVPNWIHI